MIHSLALQLARYLGAELALTETRVSIVTYGLEVLIGGLIKLIIFIAIPLILGVFNQFAAVYISAALLKLPSGGYHCTAFYRCLIFTLVIYLAMAFLSKHIALYHLPTLEILITVLCFTFIIFALYAPVDVKEKPIISKVRRLRLKITSCSILAIYLIIFFIWQPASDLVWAYIFAITFHAFTLTKPGYKFFQFIDNII